MGYVCISKYPLDKLVLSEYSSTVRNGSYDLKSIEHNNQGEGQCLHMTGQDEDNL
jgi:hypothetical protein